VPDGTFESFDGVVVAFDERFDQSVGLIPHPAVKALAHRDVLSEVSEPDALDAARDQITSSQAHAG
jgi:hypothetical protein